MEDVKTSYVELTGKDDKCQFQEIVNILNRYYDGISHGGDTPAVDFRKRFAKASTDFISVKLKLIEKYTFEVLASIGDEESTWIHVDGIQEERDLFYKERKNDSHPVFRITCVTDLYANNY